MDEAQIKSVMEKIKAAYWNRQLIDDNLIKVVRSPVMMAFLFEQLSNDDYQARTQAGFALAEIAGEQAKPALIDALSSAEWLVRAEAAEALGQYGDFQLTKYLIPMLNDPVLAVRIAATQGLEGLRDPSAVPSLIEAIKDPNRQVYAYATYALYDLAAEYELPELFPCLKSEDVHVRVATAYVLGARGGKDAVRGLIDLVRIGISGDRTEFEHALEHLRLIGQPAVNDLIALLDERDVVLIQLAIGVLAPLGDMRALPHIVAAMGDEDEQVHEVATWGVSQFGEATIPLLLDALKDKNPRLRANAAEVLGHTGSMKITGDLVGLLNDDDAVVRRKALFALEDIGDFDAVQHIIPLLKGSAQDAHNQASTASYAARVLRGRLSTPEGLAAVERWRREEAAKDI